MNEKATVQEEGINLIDLWEKVRKGWVTVVGGTALGFVAAVLACFFLQPKFEAVALVQVAQIGQVDQGKVSSVPVETPAQAIERMKNPSFQSRVANELKDQSWLTAMGDDASGTNKDLSMQVIKGTAASTIPLIELRAKGNSRESALQRAEGMVAQLTKAHAELAQAALVRMRSEITVNREKLASVERNLAELTRMVAGTGGKDDRFTQLALMSSLRVQKEAEIFSQRQMIMTLETALGAPATQSTKVIEAVFVPEKPVSPKKTLLLLLGTIGGLLAGLLCVFVMDALRGHSVHHG